MKKTVVVTGGAQGIGRISALKFHEAGYNVTVFDSDEEAVMDAKKELGNTGILFLLCNVSDEKQVKESIEDTFRKFNSIDVLINNAGTFYNKSIEILSYEEWNKYISTNLNSVFLCSKYTLPHLKASKGCIINMSSTRALMSEPDTEAYSASKGGIIALTHALAISLAPHVRVNCISPGWIEVSDQKKISKRKVPELTKEDHSQHPAGRVGVADDIVNMQLFLADNKNSFITGQNFIIDGGMTRKMIYV